MKKASAITSQELKSISGKRINPRLTEDIEVWATKYQPSLYIERIGKLYKTVGTQFIILER